jgi:radical SAM protein with 4Fe4S-binding SPASM domain
MVTPPNRVLRVLRRKLRTLGAVWRTDGSHGVLVLCAEKMGDVASVRGIHRRARRVLPQRTVNAIVRLAVVPLRRRRSRLWFALPAAIAHSHQFPEVLAISLTTQCNLRCFICRREDFQPESLDFENLKKLETPIRYAKTIDLTGWGEPFTYPRFREVLEYLFSLNSGEIIGLTTNGTRLSEEHARLLSGHLSYFVISLNAATRATYERDMKHGCFEATLSAIRSFVSALDASDRLKLNLHMVVHTENYREIPDFVVLAHELTVPTVSVGQYLVGISDHSRYSLLHIREEYNRVVEEARVLGGKLGVRVHARQFFGETGLPWAECVSPFTECFILPNGEVHPCCFCGNSVSMGNAYERGFEAVWFGNEYQRLRKRRSLPACSVCPPLLSFDCVQTHFTADLKLSHEFDEIAQTLQVSQDP